MLRASLALTALVACGGDGAWEALPGAPAATRALAVTGDDEIVAIGGASAFGLATLQRQAGDAWVAAAGVPPFDAHATLVGGRGAAGPSAGAPLYALSEAQLFEGAAWTAHNVPVGAAANSAFGVDAAGRVYALELAVDGGGAVLAWLPGETRWTEVPGSRPIGVGATQFVVTDDGQLTWVVPAVGVVRLGDAAQVTLVTCAAIGGCTEAIQGLGVADGVVSFVTCPGAAYFLSDGVMSQVDLPSDITCGTVASDGTTAVAATFPADGGEGALLEVSPGGAWNRLAPAVPGVIYARIGGQTFGYAPAPTTEAQRGIHVQR